MPSSARITRAVMLVGVLALLLLSLHAGVFGARGQCLASLGLNQAPIHGGPGKSRHRTRVDVEIFVMSKCPDAVDGEATIAKVMEKVGDKVALNVTYIVTAHNSSDGMELTCKHGPTECLANRQQLCFQKYHPDSILRFILCLNRVPSQIGNSLSYTLHCAEKTRTDDYINIIQPCAESDEGYNLLRETAERCNLLDTHTSATIRVAGNNVCVRDGGVWRNCNEVMTKGGGHVVLGLERLIEKEWNKLDSNILFWQRGNKA